MWKRRLFHIPVFSAFLGELISRLLEDCRAKQIEVLILAYYSTGNNHKHERLNMCMLHTLRTEARPLVPSVHIWSSIHRHCSLRDVNYRPTGVRGSSLRNCNEYNLQILRFNYVLPLDDPNKRTRREISSEGNNNKRQYLLLKALHYAVFLCNCVRDPLARL